MNHLACDVEVASTPPVADGLRCIDAGFKELFYLMSNCISGRQ